MTDAPYLDPDESQSPLSASHAPTDDGAPAGGSQSDPFDLESWPDEDAPPSFPPSSHSDMKSDTAKSDGLHLVAQRQPREEWAIAPILQGEAEFRHGGWRHQRQQTWDALQRIQPASMACYRFSNCGSAAWIQVTPDRTAARCVANTCHHRLCVPCQRAVGRIVTDNLRAHCKGRHLRFITLTLRHSHTPLRDQVDRLYRSWSTLRRRKDCRDCFRGGVAIMETKVSDRDGLWHVHLHILAEGTYLHHRDLSAAWHGITGDSSIVDMRQLHDNDRGIGYVCKYISKPVDASLYANPCKLDEYLLSIQGRKTMATFGTWRGLKLKQPPKDDREWVNLEPLLDFARRCRARDPEALKVLAVLRHETQPRDTAPRRREPGDDDGDDS